MVRSTRCYENAKGAQGFKRSLRCNWWWEDGNRCYKSFGVQRFTGTSRKYRITRFVTSGQPYKWIKVLIFRWLSNASRCKGDGSGQMASRYEIMLKVQGHQGNLVSKVVEQVLKVVVLRVDGTKDQGEGRMVIFPPGCHQGKRCKRL